MKIVFFTRLYYPHRGGVEKHVFEISKRLKEEGHDITIFTEDIPEVKKDTKDEFRVIRLKVGKDDFGKKDRIWKALWRHNEIIFDSDIVHCHDVFFWYLPFKILRPLKKVYTTFHGYETVFPPRKRAILVRKISEILSTGSINVGDYISKWYFSRPTLVTYGGVDVPYKAEVKKRGKRIKIAFVGRIEEDNGVYIFSEILNILSNQGFDFEFTASGDGSLKKEFQRYGEVKGFEDDSSLTIKNADIVFASSYLSILESLVQKKLVFSIFQNNLKKDYLKMSPLNDFVVSAGDPMSIVHELKKYILNEKMWNDKVEEGYEFASRQTWENVLHVYKKLWRIK